MAGLNGGARAPGNGRVSGGKAGPEHRYSRQAVDTDRWDAAKEGAVAADGRGWSGDTGERLRYPNTEGGPPRGAMMGPAGPGPNAPRGFMGLGDGSIPGKSGGTNAGRTRAGQSYNDKLCTYEGVVK